MDAMEALMALSTPEDKADPYPLYAALHELGEAVDLGPGGAITVGLHGRVVRARSPAGAAGPGDWVRRPATVARPGPGRPGTSGGRGDRSARGRARTPGW